MSGKKRGRPKGTTQEPTRTVTTRLTDAQHELLKRAARGDGRTVSNYLMMLIVRDLAGKKAADLAPEVKN